jgi:hypothetical protein
LVLFLHLFSLLVSLVSSSNLVLMVFLTFCGHFFFLWNFFLGTCFYIHSWTSLLLLFSVLVLFLCVCVCVRLRERESFLPFRLCLVETPLSLFSASKCFPFGILLLSSSCSVYMYTCAHSCHALAWAWSMHFYCMFLPRPGRGTLMTLLVHVRVHV